MPKSLVQLATRVQQPADWVIPNLLARQNTMMLVGEPKRAAKSWLAFNLGMDLADGQNVWGVTHSKGGNMLTPVRPMRTLMFAQEDTEDNLQDRLNLMMAAGRAPSPNFFYETKDRGLCFDGGPGESRIYQSVASCAPIDLIIIDPMRRMHRLDENNSMDMDRFFGALMLLQSRFNCSCLVIHHLTKPGKDAVSRKSPHAMRGSGDIFGSVDSIVNVVPAKRPGNPNKGVLSREVNLYFEHKRDIALVPLTLSVSFTTGLVTFAGYLP